MDKVSSQSQTKSKRKPWYSPQRNKTPKKTANATTPKDNRKKAQKYKEDTACICDNKECDLIMQKLMKLDKNMHIYFDVPKPPAPENTNRKTKMKPQQKRNRKA